MTSLFIDISICTILDLHVNTLCKHENSMAESHPLRIVPGAAMLCMSYSLKAFRYMRNIRWPSAQENWQILFMDLSQWFEVSTCIRKEPVRNAGASKAEAAWSAVAHLSEAGTDKRDITEKINASRWKAKISFQQLWYWNEFQGWAHV